MTLWHYYAKWSCSKFSPPFARDLNTKYNKLLLKSFLCIYSNNWIMHFYCSSKDWKTVVRDLRTYDMKEYAKCSDRTWWACAQKGVVEMTVPNWFHIYNSQYWINFDKWNNKQKVPLKKEALKHKIEVD